MNQKLPDTRPQPTHAPTRREFLWKTAAATSGIASLTHSASAENAPSGDRVPVIDCHVHCGIGQALQAPYSTENSPEHILRNMKQGGIDQCVIFPMSNTTYEEANIAIAETCRRIRPYHIGARL